MFFGPIIEKTSFDRRHPELRYYFILGAPGVPADQFPTLIHALTGGIATGKSTAVRLFREFLPDIVVFDCDLAVRRLLETEVIAKELAALFDEGIPDPSTLGHRAAPARR